eukprot:COSAG02_NODE_6836_length_3336_cov_4.197405_3_plen_108_part_00
MRKKVPQYRTPGSDSWKIKRRGVLISILCSLYWKIVPFLDAPLGVQEDEEETEQEEGEEEAEEEESTGSDNDQATPLAYGMSNEDRVTGGNKMIKQSVRLELDSTLR